MAFPSLLLVEVNFYCSQPLNYSFRVFFYPVLTTLRTTKFISSYMVLDICVLCALQKKSYLVHGFIIVALTRVLADNAVCELSSGINTYPYISIWSGSTGFKFIVSVIANHVTKSGSWDLSSVKDKTSCSLKCPHHCTVTNKFSLR